MPDVTDHLSVDDIALYVGGSATEATRLATIALHVEGCDDCRHEVVAAMRAARGSRPETAADLELAIGSQIGRYRVTAARGSGAMGHVLEAVDPDLQRTIAIKVIRHLDDDDDARALREGRALARLAHPGIVAIHDVGTWSGGVFLAMELVPGVTLRAWGAQRRPWRQVVRAIADAARALHAAHEQGVIHRDIKPDNLLVGGDGRVRVVDFGLAIARDEQTTPAGTPAYMAPELVAGARADARSDQFALFVCLAELLGDKVPATLRATIERGRAAAPDRRFHDLGAAARALDSIVSRRRRIAIAMLAVAAVAVVGSTVAFAHRDSAPCSGGTLAGIWDARRERAIATTFAGFHLPYGDAVSHTVNLQLSRYANSWLAMHEDACKATHVSHEQSAELLDLRMECLRDRAARLRTLAERFETTRERRTVENAVALAGLLPSLDECANRELLMSPQKLPADPVGRARVAMLHERLLAVEAARNAGHDARAQVDAIVAEARAVGHLPTLARALLALGAVQMLHEPEAGFATLREGMRVAEQAHADDIRADGALSLVGFIAHRFKTGEDLARATELAKDGEASIRRIGGDPLRLGHLKMNYAVVLRMGDKAAESLAEHERAIALLGQAHASPVEVATEEATMALALEDLGNYDRALHTLEHARSVLEPVLGPSHPKIAILLDLESDVLTVQGNPAEAKRRLDRAFSISDKLDHFDDGPALIHLAQAYGGLGQHEQQLATAERALAHYMKADGEGSLYTVAALEEKGTAQLALGHLDLAAATFQHTLEIRVKIFGPDDSDVAQSHRDVGGVHLRKRDFRAGRAAYREALRIDEAVARTNLRLVVDLLGLARSDLGLRRYDDAIAEAERARSLCNNEVEADQRAQVELALARGLWDSGRDRARARKVATEARASAAASKLAAGKADVAEIAAWLASH